MQQNGAQILISALEAQGVDTIFGYPGGAVLEIYDALKNSNIHHVLVRNEQGGAHAASGYARATGKVGVCLATSGMVQPIWLQGLLQPIWILFQS